MNETIQQLKDFYAGLEPTQQKLFLGAVFGSLLLLVGVGVWAQGETWSPVMTGGTDEVRRAAGALSGDGISYRIRNDGTSLQVVEADVGAADLAIAGIGMQPDRIAEIDLPIGLPPAMQDRVLRDMLQNELAHMIRQIDVVDHAWVSITQADTGNYLKDETEARAAIVVSIREGASISERQVKSIVNLTAMAVQDLDPGRISLSDQDGNLLHSPDGDGIGAGGSELLTLQIERERRIEAKVREALTAMFGVSNAATVHATLELDHDEQTVVRQDVDPDRVVVTDESTSESTQTRGDARGAAGAESNTGSGMVGDSSQTSESMQFQSKTIASTADSIVQKRPGEIKRMSLTVLVDERRIRGLAEATLEGAEVDEAQISAAATRIQEQIEVAVNAAAGFDAERGDTVAVGFVPFHDLVVVPDAAPAAAAATSVLPWMPYAVAVLALGLVFGFVVRPVVKAVTRTPEEIAAAVAAASGEAAEADEDVEDDDDDLAGRLRLLVENYEPVDAADLNKLVDREAEAAAQVLRQWSARS